MSLSQKLGIKEEFESLKKDFLESPISHRYFSDGQLILELITWLPNNFEYDIQAYNIRSAVLDKKADCLSLSTILAMMINHLSKETKAEVELIYEEPTLHTYYHSIASITQPTGEVFDYNIYNGIGNFDKEYPYRLHLSEEDLANLLKYKVGYIEGDYSTASKYGKRFLRLNPNDIKIKSGVAYSEMMLGRYNSTIKLYKGVLKLEPNDKETHFNLGLIYHDLYKAKDAIAHLELARKLGWEEPMIDFALGECYAMCNKYDKAIELLEKSLRIGLDDENIKINLAECYFYIGRVEKAMSLAKEVINVNPNVILSFTSSTQYPQ